MNNHKTYSKEEVDSNINTLNKELEFKIIQRKSLNSDIRNTKKQIEFWMELDKNQYKMF